MNRFLPKSNNLPTRPSLTIILLLLIASYLLPWIVSSGAGLTFGGYDLAEWTSLHPRVSQNNPPLITTLLLRLPPTCIAIIAALHARPWTSAWWIGTTLVFIIAIALLPPLEFIDDRGNTNYRQMLILSVITLLVGGIGLTGKFYRWRWGIITVTAIMGAIASTLGLLQAYDLYAQFYLPRNIGLGGILTVILFLCILGIGLHSTTRK